MSEQKKSTRAERYAEILRTRAIVERNKKPGGSSGLAANFDGAADELERLTTEVSAARRMRNEIVGICALAEHEMRDFAGNTNYYCLVDAVKEFDRVSGKQS